MRYPESLSVHLVFSDLSGTHSGSGNSEVDPNFLGSGRHFHGDSGSSLIPYSSLVVPLPPGLYGRGWRKSKVRNILKCIPFSEVSHSSRFFFFFFPTFRKVDQIGILMSK